MKQAKPIAITVLIVLAVVVMLQNTEAVETRILFASVIMPRAILLVVTLALGFGIGILVSGRWTRKKT